MSVPGCGKGDDEEGEANNNGGSSSSTINGFGNSGGQGQAGIRSENNCYEVSRQGDGSVRFPIATSPSQPHYYQGGYLYATAYVADTFYTGGNHYSTQNAYNDTLDVFISSNDEYFNGDVYLANKTVRDILVYLGQSADEDSLCVDGITFQQVLINGGPMQGYMTLWVKNYPVIYF